jgi:hypothetical protein
MTSFRHADLIVYRIQYRKKRRGRTLFTKVLPILVRRCKGTSAGLAYLKVSVDCLCISPPWPVGIDRPVNTHCDELYNFSDYFNI